MERIQVVTRVLIQDYLLVAHPSDEELEDESVVGGEIKCGGRSAAVEREREKVWGRANQAFLDCKFRAFLADENTDKLTTVLSESRVSI